MTDRQDLAAIIPELIRAIGDDPEREGLKDTPFRVRKSYDELFSGYTWSEKSIKEVLLKTFDPHLSNNSPLSFSEIILVKDIEFYSLCEHHLLPFFGKAHVAYIPRGRVLGVSKLARLVEAYSRRLQIQERICSQVTQALMTLVDPIPAGAACVLEAKHFCMICRGINKQNSIMVTSSLEGVFQNDDRTRAEFFSLIK